MKRKLCYVILLSFVLCMIISGCSNPPEKYDISVYINGAIHGRVNDDVSGTYTEGQDVTIVATPYEGQEFFCWLHYNKVVSTDATYTFEINEQNSGAYIALFKCADLEYISLESFSFSDMASNITGDIATTLKSLKISFGPNQNELTEVFSSVATSEQVVNTTVDFNTLYPEDSLPYAFKKTQGLYIKISATYERAGLEYLSETIFNLNKGVVGTPFDNVENKVLNAATAVLNQELPPLENSETNSISINFKALETFIFKAPEDPQE